MYRLVTKADGSFQILDEDGENYGIFGDQDEALKAMELLAIKYPDIEEFPAIVVHHKEGMSEKHTVWDLGKISPKKPKPHRTVTKKIPTVVKRSPIKAKRGRPKKVR